MHHHSTPLVVGFLFLLSATASGGDSAIDKINDGRLLTRTGTSTWQVLAKGASIPAGKTLLALPGTKAEITAASGRLRLALLGQHLLTQPSATSLGCALALKADNQGEPILNLERGAVLLTSAGKKALKVSLRLRSHILALQLEPGAQVLLEAVQAWPTDAPMPLDPSTTHEPVVLLRATVLQREVELRQGTTSRLLNQQTRATWDSASQALNVEKVDLKSLSDADTSPRGKALTQALVTLAQQEPAALKLPASNASEAQALAVLHVAAATDNLPVLLQGLGLAGPGSIRAGTIELLRHWIGQEGKRPYHLTLALQKSGLGKAGASNFVQMLRELTPVEKKLPEVYELLIDNLMNPRVEVRTLSAWHLYRTVPQGAKIAYDPTASEAARRAAQSEWRKLIPSGQLPPQ